MKIAFFQNYYTPYRHELFNKISAKGIDVSVVYAHYPEDEKRKWRMREADCKYKMYQSRRIIAGRRVIFFPPADFFKEKYDFSVVLDNTPTNLSMLMISIILRLKKSKIIVWVEHIEFKTNKITALYQFLMSYLMINVSDFVLALSEKSSSYAKCFSIKRPVAVLPQATEEFLYETDKQFIKRDTKLTFGYIGSSEPRKNLIGLISAFNRILGNSVLIIAGTEPNCDCANSSIKYIGYVDGHVKEDFSSIDILVLPSLHEPWGLVVNEALARGVLPLVSKSCGSSELVANIDSRLVFDPDQNSIYDALKMCVNFSESDWIIFNRKRREVLSEYSMNSAACKLISIIETIHNENTVRY